MNSTYYNRKAEGRCVTCGVFIELYDANTRCPDCREARRIDAKRYRENVTDYNHCSKALRLRRTAAHQCTACGTPLPDGYGYKRCEWCRARRRRYNSELLAKHRDEWRCFGCGGPNTSGYNRCDACRALASVTAGDRYNARWRRHECVRCGAKLADDYWYTNCESCRAKHNASSMRHWQRKKERENANMDG